MIAHLLHAGVAEVFVYSVALFALGAAVGWIAETRGGASGALAARAVRRAVAACRTRRRVVHRHRRPRPHPTTSVLAARIHLTRHTYGETR